MNLVLTDTNTIREVLLFPYMRPEARGTTLQKQLEENEKVLANVGISVEPNTAGAIEDPGTLNP